jgi:hypothetical protein
MSPRAVPRWPGGSNFATEALASAGIAAAPVACTMRPKTSSGRFGAKAHSSDPRAKTRSPRQKAHLKLKTSEARP